MLYFCRRTPLPRPISGSSESGKTKKFAVLGDDRDMVARDPLDRRHHRAVGQVHHLLARAGLGQNLVGGHDKPVARVGGHDQFVARPMDQQVHDFGIVGQIDHQADRFPHPPRAGQVRAQKREEPPVGCRQQDAVGRFGMEEEPPLVAVLELDFGSRRLMALHRPDPAHLRTDDSDRLAFDHRLDRHVLDHARVGESRPALAALGVVAKGLLHLGQFRADLFPLLAVGGQQILQPRAFLQQRVIFALQLHLLELAQGPQAHVEDGFRLIFRQLALALGRRNVVLFGHGARMGFAPVLGHQRALGVTVIADDVDDPVEVQESGDEAFQYLKPRIDLFQPVLRAPLQHHAAMVEKGAQHFLERTDLGHPPVDQHIHVQRKAHFQFRVAKEHAHQHLGVDVLRFRFQHDPHIVGTFVAHVGQRRDLLGLDHLGQTLDQLGFLHLIGDLGDDDLPGAAPLILDRPACAQAKGAAAGAVGFQNILARLDDDAAGGEIGARDQCHKRRVRHFAVADHQLAGVDQLVQVVGRNVRGHADRDARGTIGQKVREGCGQHDRLFQRAVIIRAEVDGIFRQPLHQRFRRRRQAGFGIAAGGRVIAVDIAEVALPVHQGIAHGKGLREPRHGIINRHVAMRMVVPHHIARDLGRLAKATRGRQFQLAHRIKDAPVDRLQPVTRIGQGAVHDRRQGIGQIPLADRPAEGL